MPFTQVGCPSAARGGFSRRCAARALRRTASAGAGHRWRPQFARHDPQHPFGWLLGPLTHGYLFLVDERGRLVPDRVLRLPSRENGLISADGRTITYEIRTGRWSDGAPYNARDVAFTVEALRNPRTSMLDTSAVAPIAAVAVRAPTAWSCA